MSPAKAFPKIDRTKYCTVGKGGIQKQLESSGRLPPVELLVQPISGAKPFMLDKFLNYEFQSSILIPVDTFSFSFAAPETTEPFSDVIKEGDIVSLLANGIPISTGLVDRVEVETDTSFGDRATISGRDLMGQLEDQDAVSLTSEQIWANSGTVLQNAQKLIQNTRIRGVKLSGVPSALSRKANVLMATEPGENKLSALQRLLEPLNLVAWMDPTGYLIVGKPNMKQGPKSQLVCSKSRRYSNVVSMRSTRESATIPNAIIPIWSGQESVISRVPKQQVIYNRATGPHRLRTKGHLLAKTVTISNPQGADAQSLSEVNRLRSAAGSSNLVQAYAKRELARANVKELLIQAIVPGHYNEMGEPWLPDTVYTVEYDRDGILEKMYLFQVSYHGEEGQGQRTNLQLCRLGTVVADNEAT